MKGLRFYILLLFFVTISTFSQEKKYITYKVLPGETIESIAKKLSITPYNLLQLNPDIKDEIIENQLLIIPNSNFIKKPDIEKGDYIKDGFLYHKVLPQENYYRLRKQFGVAKRILRKHNLALRTSDLKAGQIIKIPIDNNYQLETIPKVVEDRTTKPYLVRPKETKYSISRRYGISVERLEELNPHIKEGLKIADIIKVPNTLAIENPDSEYVMHQVEKGETIFSLSQKFKISQSELKENNPELILGLKEGMLVRIPKESFAVSTNVFVVNIPENKELKIAMLLPFTTGKNELDFENDRTLNIVTDFYLGALMALDSLKNHGLSISAKVFDTQNNKNEIAHILRLNDFEDLDAIVGPMFLDNVKFVSQNLRNKSVPIISPVSSKDHGSFGSINIVKETPSDEILIEKVLSYIESNYKGQNIIIVADDKIENESKLLRLKIKLNKIDSIHEVKVLKPKDGYIKPDLFRSTILEDKENWVVLMTDDIVLTADVVNNLGVLPEKVKTTLFGLNYGNNFEKIDNNFLARLNFHYATTTFIDYENPDVKRFIKKFKSKHRVDPSEFVFRGFDMTYDSLARLATLNGYENAFNGGISERTSSKFYYTKDFGKCFENNGAYLIKYDGLSLKKIE